MKDILMGRITDVMNRANKIKIAHLEYQYLWTDSRVEYMENFLTYGRQLTQVPCGHFKGRTDEFLNFLPMSF